MARVNKRTFLNYTMLFLLVAAVIYMPFLLEGKSFIHEGDGYHQHYPFFRQYLNIIRDFFQTGNWQQWDWSIGLGQDTLLTYGYYVVGDPFVYLGLLFPEGSEELAFHAVMFVRIWAVGASFLLYARQMRFGEWSALAATMTYAFSHFVIYNVTRHPFFIHSLIFFPLIALGIEKIFQKESGAFFALMIGLAAISNFYFFYMLTLLAFFYALLRYPDYVQGWKNFTQWLLKFVAFYLVGVLISAVIFLPQVYGFLSASRSPTSPPVSMFAYPLEYYGLLILNAITPGTKFWTVGGLSILAVLTLPFLARNRHKKPGLFWGLVILSVMLLFPIFGSMMNGFSGPYNRFTFILPFFLASALAYFLDHLGEMGERDVKGIKWLMIGFTLIYGVATFVTQDYFLYLTPLVIGWGAYFVLSNGFDPKQIQKIAIALAALNMATNALIFYTPLGKNAMSGTEDYGTIDASYQNTFDNLEEQLPQDEWYRIGVSSKDNQVRNHYAYLDVDGTNSYASLTNGAVSDFARMIETSQYQVIQPLRNGIDDRRVVNQGLGVRYIITDKENEAYLPPGYTIRNQNENMLVAETEYAAPFAYVENQAVLSSDLDQMHPVQRESLLADAVIVEDEFDGFEPLASLPPLTTHYGERGVEVEGESELVLDFDAPENQEVFLYIEGISYESEGSASYRLNAQLNQQEKSVLQSNPYSFSSYFHRENILIHLGEMVEEEETLTIEFQDEGVYDFEKVSVVSRPYEEPDSREDRALDVEVFEDEYVKGRVETEAGMLVTNIPYSTGWTARVNGEKVETEKVNVGFIGVPLDAGEHTVEFVYETPFLKIGFVLTMIGLTGVFVYSRKYWSK